MNVLNCVQTSVKVRHYHSALRLYISFFFAFHSLTLFSASGQNYFNLRGGGRSPWDLEIYGSHFNATNTSTVHGGNSDETLKFAYWQKHNVRGPKLSKLGILTQYCASCLTNFHREFFWGFATYWYKYVTYSYTKLKCGKLWAYSGNKTWIFLLFRRVFLHNFGST